MPGIADISVATFVLTKVMKDALACTNPARDGQLDIVFAARFMQPAQDMVAAVHTIKWRVEYFGNRIQIAGEINFGTRSEPTHSAATASASPTHL